MYVLEDLTPRSLPDNKILTPGKWGATCDEARGRPSNACLDPVKEKHAPTAALEGRKQVSRRLAKRQDFYVRGWPQFMRLGAWG